MTRLEALDQLRKLAHGLRPDLAGSARLLERIAAHEDAEELRAALVECGARLVLDSWSA